MDTLYNIDGCASPLVPVGDIVAQCAYLKGKQDSIYTIYEATDLIWRAFVTKRDSKYVLWVQIGGFDKQAIEGGEFTDGAVVVRCVRAGAAAKFGKDKPTIDTLSVLEKRTPDSVVPECYGEFVNLKSEKCDNCSYSDLCLSKATGVGLDLADEAVEEELEDLFLKRLHGKVKEKWGG